MTDVDAAREARIAALVDAMTLDEQVSLLAGADFWSTVPVPRLGVPSIRVSDGPNGARGGGSLVGGVKAAAFPVGIALAATWNPALVGQVGAALAEEAKSKGARVLLAPTVNIHRSTLNGRNFECYSEDPWLTAEIAVAYIRGLQGRGVAAAVKHFVGNESEYQRKTISSDIDERTLHEIYLAPFEAAVKRAGTWALMTSYNRLNGRYVSERAELVNGLLKRDWGFDGLVMSDWFGTNSNEPTASAGLDLEMPGPARHRGEHLAAACWAGAVPAEAVREGARRVLRLIDRVGAFADPATPEERADDRPETRALIRRAGAEAIVLLKNDGVLPLGPAPMRVAVIGPNAAEARIMGGGSAQLNPHYSVSPLEGLRAALPAGSRVEHAPGCSNDRLVPAAHADVTIEFFDGTDLAGPVRHRRTAENASYLFLGDETPGFSPRNYSARAAFTHTPTVGGEHRFGVVASGPTRMLLDGEAVVDVGEAPLGGEYFGWACDEVVATRTLVAGRAYKVVVETRSSPPGGPPRDLVALRTGIAPALGDAAVAEAAALAARSDVALVFVGLSGEWDGEGQDRPHIDLPGRQDALVAAVAATGTPTVVVLQTGCPATMPWLGAASAVLQAWYGGQEAGNSIADVLLGRADPGGRLPQTFPRRLEDDPAFLDYPGADGRVRYGEGVFVGYRSYEERRVEPLFPFGFGLSYAAFRLGALALSAAELAPGEALEASVEVENAGAREGWAVVQFYVADPACRVARPPKELKGAVKLRLAPGERRTAAVRLGMRDLAFYDARHGGWAAEAGAFRVTAGLSSADAAAEAAFALTGDWFDAPPSPPSDEVRP